MGKGGDTAGRLNAGLPNITASIQMRKAAGNSSDDGANLFARATGAFSVTYGNGAVYSTYLNTSGGNQLANDTFYFDANDSNNVYGAANTVQPAAISLIPQIRF